jgi:hypothetical protein
MMKTSLHLKITLIICLMFCLCVMENAAAQRPQLFGGRGIVSPDDADAGEETGMHWPRLSDFTMGDRDAEARSSLFRYGGTGKGLGSMFRRDETETGESRGSFLNFLSQRDPSAPNLFHQLGDRSRNLMQRTTNWAHERNQSFREKTFDTWDSMTKNLLPTPRRAVDAQAVPYEQAAQPPLRTAEQFNVTPSDRY